MNSTFESFFENIPEAMEAAFSNPLGVAVFVIGLGALFSLTLFIRSPLRIRLGIFIAFWISAFLFVALSFVLHVSMNSSDSPDLPPSPTPFPTTALPSPAPFPTTVPPSIAYGSICYTFYGSCRMGNPPSMPVGTSCFCPTLFGPVSGAVGQ